MAAAMIFALTGAANAATLDVTLGSTNNSASLGFNSAGAAINPNINLNTPSPASLVLNFNSILTATTDSSHTTPSGTLFGGNYLAVMGSGGTGSATFTLAPNENAFAFTWGTIDGYNSLILTDSRSVTYTITGTQILNHITGPIPGTTQSDVSFFDPFGQIVSAQLTSSLNAFEAANFSEGDPTTAPLPPALILFGSALVGLTLFSRYKART
jgi:hypothetical protein